MLSHTDTREYSPSTGTRRPYRMHRDGSLWRANRDDAGWECVATPATGETVIQIYDVRPMSGGAISEISERLMAKTLWRLSWGFDEPMPARWLPLAPAEMRVAKGGKGSALAAARAARIAQHAWDAPIWIGGRCWG